MKQYMRGNDKRGKSFSSFSRDKQGSRGPKPQWSKHDGGDRKQRYDATCSECGDHCTVPFRPVGNKPVACDRCFGKKERGSEDRRPTSSFSSARPSWKSNDDRRSSTGGGDMSGIKQQMDRIEKKLDTIIAALESGDDDEWEEEV
jgi:CxxC-x17-CxxC domain-containing protein